MRYDSKLSGVLHILLHMAEQNGPITSEALAKMMSTNSAVVRRIMGGLRNRRYVQSEKGHGGGWKLSIDLDKVTLKDIYEAVGSPSLLAIGNRSESPECLVEQAVNAALQPTFDAAEQFLLARLGEVKLSMLSKDVQKRIVARSRTRTAKGKAHG